jgi:hypothetical protein
MNNMVYNNQYLSTAQNIFFVLSTLHSVVLMEPTPQYPLHSLELFVYINDIMPVADL